METFAEGEEEDDFVPAPCPQPPQLPATPDLDSSVPVLPFSFLPLSASVQWLTASVEALQSGLQQYASTRVDADKVVNKRFEDLEKNLQILANKKPEVVAPQVIEKVVQAPPPEPEPTDYSELEEAALERGFLQKEAIESIVAEAIDNVRQELQEEYSSGFANLQETLAGLQGRLDTMQTDTEASLVKLQTEAVAQNEKVAFQFGKIDDRIGALQSQLEKSANSHNERFGAFDAEMEELKRRTSSCEKRIGEHDATLEAHSAKLGMPRETAVVADPALAQAQRRAEAELARLGGVVKSLEEARVEAARRLAELEQKERDRAERERLAALVAPEVLDDGVNAKTRALIDALQQDVDERMQQLHEICNRGSPQLYKAMKAMERQNESVEGKVNDLWKRMPKLVAMLEPLQEEADNYRERVENGEGGESDGSGKSEMMLLIGMMREALQRTLSEFHGELSSHLDEVAEEVKGKADIEEVMVLSNRLDAWAMQGSVKKKVTVGSSPWITSTQVSPTGISSWIPPAKPRQSPNPGGGPLEPVPRGMPAFATESRELGGALLEGDESEDPPCEQQQRGRFRDSEAAAVVAARAGIPHGHHGAGCHDSCKHPTNPRSSEMQRSLSRLSKLPRA